MQSGLEALETFAKRLKFARILRDLSQSELAELAGTTQKEISKIEVGLRGFTSDIFSIARALQVSAEWLFEGKERTAISIIHSYNETVIDDSTDYPVIAHYCPILDWAEAGETIKRGDPELVSKRAQRVPLSRHDSLNSYALIMDGDSMVTGDASLISFMPGDILIFDPEREPKVGDYVLARAYGEPYALFRQYVRDSGLLYLKPNNPRFQVLRLTSRVEIVAVWSTRYTLAK